MTVASTEAVFSYGGQSAKGTLATTWYRHKASRVNVGPQDLNPPTMVCGGEFHASFLDRELEVSINSPEHRRMIEICNVPRSHEAERLRHIRRIEGNRPGILAMQLFL